MQTIVGKDSDALMRSVWWTYVAGIEADKDEISIPRKKRNGDY